MKKCFPFPKKEETQFIENKNAWDLRAQKLTVFAAQSQGPTYPRTEVNKFQLQRTQALF